MAEEKKFLRKLLWIWTLLLLGTVCCNTVCDVGVQEIRQLRLWTEHHSEPGCDGRAAAQLNTATVGRPEFRRPAFRPVPYPAYATMPPTSASSRVGISSRSREAFAPADRLRLLACVVLRQ